MQEYRCLHYYDFLSWFADRLVKKHESTTHYLKLNMIEPVVSNCAMRICICCLFTILQVVEDEEDDANSTQDTPRTLPATSIGGKPYGSKSYGSKSYGSKEEEVDEVEVEADEILTEEAVDFSMVKRPVQQTTLRFRYPEYKYHMDLFGDDTVRLVHNDPSLEKFSVKRTPLHFVNL